MPDRNDREGSGQPHGRPAVFWAIDPMRGVPLPFAPMSAAPQIVCPVCFTQQDNAWDCAVCGSALHDRPKHWAVPVEQVQELEPTLFGDAGNVSLEPMPDLELTSADDGVEPLPDMLDGLELTRYDDVPEPLPDAVPAFEPTAIDAPAPAAVPGPVACRYCGTPWQAGMSVFCARCGMRVASRPAPAPVRADASAVRTCRGCGMPDQALGSLCKSCQQPITR